MLIIALIVSLATLPLIYLGYRDTLERAVASAESHFAQMMRAYMTQLDSLKDALKAVLQKSIQTQNELQQSNNQTRARILG